LFRPISLYPFPKERLAELAESARALLVVEMNAGQMIEDVQLAVAGRVPVEFFGRMGGVVPLPDEVLAAIQRLAGQFEAFDAELETTLELYTGHDEKSSEEEL
jgi:2-oxoglutarate ferredoxin oxidoreductase subunit alpha